MKESKLTLHIQMPTEMSDIPSINVYDGDELIATHEMIYAEDLYCAIIGKFNFYDEINRVRYESNINRNWCLTCQSKEDCKGIDDYSMMTKEQCISGNYCFYCEED